MSVTATTYNGAIPNLPQAINAQIEIFEGQSVLIDLSLQLTLGKIAGVQTIFVDLSKHDGDVFITMLDTLQTICAKAGTQGYYPVLSTSLMKFEVVSNTDGNFPIQFINFPIALGVWGQSGSSATLVENTTLSGVPLACEQNPNKLILNKLIAGQGITISDDCGQIVISATPENTEELIYSGNYYTIIGSTSVTDGINNKGFKSTENTFINPELIDLVQDTRASYPTSFRFPKSGIYRFELVDLEYTNEAGVTLSSSSDTPFYYSTTGLILKITDYNEDASATSNNLPTRKKSQLFDRNIYHVFELNRELTEQYPNSFGIVNSTIFYNSNNGEQGAQIYRLIMNGKINIYRTKVIDVP